MKYRVKGKAMVWWVEKTSDSFEHLHKVIDIDEYIESDATLTVEQAQDKVENLVRYQRYNFDWVTMTEVSRVA
jgi:hypothetical protein